MAPGRHRIGQRRPPPDAGHVCAGYTRFWLLTPQEVLDHCAHLPVNDQTIRPQRPTTTSGFMPRVPTRRARTICVMPMIGFILECSSFALSLLNSVEPTTHTPPLSLALSQTKVSATLSLYPSPEPKATKAQQLVVVTDHERRYQVRDL